MTNHRPLRHIGTGKQSGAILLFAAVGMSLIVILLSITNIGFLYTYKREYQKTADLAALAGARKLIAQDGSRSCINNATPAATTNANQNLGSRVHTTVVTCGKWNPSAVAPFPRFDTAVTSDQVDAVRVVISGTPPRFLPFTPPTLVSAEATALADQPVAQLTIRSTLATVDTQQSALLNGVVGGLLGGSVNLPVASWNGLLNTNINLLTYLDALAVELGVNAGNYDGVLSAPVSVGQLLQVAASVLPAGSAPDVSASLNDLGQLGANLPPIVLGDLLNVQSNVPTSALDVGLNVLQLVEGSVQLAGKDSVASVNLPVNIPGVASATVKLKVIEPPQPSAIGNPALAKADPYGEDEIYVRTAQVRALVTLNLNAVTNLVGNLTDALSPLLNPIVNFLNSTELQNLNLLGAVGDLLTDVFNALLTICNNNCTARNQVYAEGLAQPLQVSIDAAGAEARVMDYTCPKENKSLTADAKTSVAYLRVGSMNESEVFSSVSPVVKPVSVVEIGYRRVRPRQCLLLLGIGSCSDLQWEQPNGSWKTDGKSTAKKYVISGLGLKVDSPVGGTSTPQLTYVTPTLPEIGETPEYKSVSSSSVVNSLGDTLANVSLLPYNSGSNGVLGGLLNGTLSLLSGVITTVQGLISSVLAGLLDPIVDTLLSSLGIQLDASDVGATMSCDGGGATLVD